MEPRNRIVEEAGNDICDYIINALLELSLEKMKGFTEEDVLRNMNIIKELNELDRLSREDEELNPRNKIS